MSESSSSKNGSPTLSSAKTSLAPLSTKVSPSSSTKVSPSSSAPPSRINSNTTLTTEDLLPLVEVINQPIDQISDLLEEKLSVGFFNHPGRSSFVPERVSFANVHSSSFKGEVASGCESGGEDDETVLNFSMHVKTRTPVVRKDESEKPLRDDTYDPIRYRPQVLINDWYEVSQRRELNKGRHLKLQKGPHTSAYDWHYQPPFAKKMVDPEECARRNETHSRRLWTYLTDPTEYSENFNEPYRKK
ncbi:uncharacterized protein LOC132197423 [Neocloeon triangulifer]|uniref:uncharacterized protein LOC132197423 n=1 Tax=Neocloeon triangulifer TaxID=2078957 RepID=UPI00286F8FCA|nr:uncharacterized protein LOC132197423 [Neocloeon triangulifer]